MLLHLKNISFHYPYKNYGTNDIPILKNISFSINYSEKIALIGANGSGKSTLLHQIAGCLVPNKGTITLLDEVIVGKPKKSGKYIGLLFQNPEVQLLLPSVREEFLFALKTKGIHKDQLHQHLHKTAELFECAQLLDTPPQRLSIGEKQKVALALLLILEPKLLLLDEPTAPLDPRTRKKLIQTLMQINTTLLIATHDLDLALMVATRVLILKNGSIVADGTPKHILMNKELLEENHLELPLMLQKI